MNAFWHAFHFLHPQWLWLLVLLPVPLLLARNGGQAEAALRRLVDAPLLPHVTHRFTARRRWGVPAAMLGWLLLCVAMAGPAWRRVPQPLYASQAAQVVALSMSRRMLVSDVTPDRLTRARYKTQALLDANASGQNGLVAYAGEAFVVAPLTSDAHALSDLLSDLAPDTMPAPGNDAADAIRRGAKLLEHAGWPHGSLVLVTDTADRKAVQAARAAHDAGVRISVLGVGTPSGGPIPRPDGSFRKNARGKVVMARRDDAALRRLAKAGGGIYVPMTANDGDIHRLAGMLHARGSRKVDGGASAARWIDEGPWLLLALLPLAALMFRRGWLLFLPWLLLPLWPRPAHAGGLRDLWQRRDQQAAQALAAGHPKEAEKLARSPALRGTAAYRAGDYAAAIRAFRRARGARATYNLGNALARAGHYRKAVDAYDRALKANPHDSDAAANRKAVLDWLRQHPPPKGKGQGGSHQGQGHGNQGGHGASQGKPGSHRQGGKSGSASGRSSGKNPSSGEGRGKRQQGHHGSDNGRAAPDAGKAAQQQAEAKRARQALRKQMDRALGAQGSKGTKQGSYALGQPQHGPRHGPRLSAPMQQALERVPDDPGGLLRRKFDLEYQRRHAGHNGDSDGNLP